VLKSADQLNSLRIGVDKGTTNEITLREKFPKATIVASDDTPFGFAALRTGNVQAITQDGPKPTGLLANVPRALVPPSCLSEKVHFLKGSTCMLVFSTL
jgi:polar amino acid transport system substrate-binding protein